MKTIQDWIYNIEVGPARLWLVRTALFFLVIGISAWIGIREFNGLRTFEAMDTAQQARQLVENKGFTTLIIRPLALWQVRSNLGNEAPSVGSFPETLTPPLYPVVLGVLFKVGIWTKFLSFEISPDSLKGFKVFTPDLFVLALQLGMLVATAFLVFRWGHRQFDIGTGLLAVAFFLGSSPVWTKAVEDGVTLMVIFLYAIAGCFFCLGSCAQEEDENSAMARIHFFLAGLSLSLSALVQAIQVWSVLGAAVLSWLILRRGKFAMLSGLVIGMSLFLLWLGRLWLVSKNPIGLNWGFLLVDSAQFPGDMIWRSYNFDLNKTDVWRRVGGSILRGFSDLLSRGPALFGNVVAGTLALVGLLHVFRRASAEAGRNLWGGVLAMLVLATSFVQRPDKSEGHPILMAILPAVCVYGAAYLWIIIERWRLNLELLGKLCAILVGLIAAWPTISRVIMPEPPPFAYPPTYPPIFLFMKEWFEPGELQASDLPAAEAWYTEQPTLWLPTTREDFLKIHDRVSPVFSILLTPASSDVRMYSQMMADNSEWKEWADLIRRQKPPDLPQAFATSLPPNNDYLLLSIQKRWN